jgi:hypothetical protein
VIQPSSLAPYNTQITYGAEIVGALIVVIVGTLLARRKKAEAPEQA